MTQPSAGDALTQLLGFKPASVAEAQEKQGDRIEIGEDIKNAKQSIMRAYVSSQNPEAKAAAKQRMDEFNKRFPESRIKFGDIRGLSKMRIEDEKNVSRHVDVRKATDF